MSETNNSEINTTQESKYYKMKKVVTAIKEYLAAGTEEMAIKVSRFLQALSVTIDLSIFDPHTSIACEFFVSLYELMSKLEQRSPFTWYCVDVLSNSCRNSAARHALIETYQFLSSLSRLLGDHLTTEKKITLLRLMQDVTCGIKISWQIPHLPHLMKTLSRWIESPDEEIVCLALGVLVNVCYKNLPAIYTLTANVDIKKIIKVCIPLTGPIVEAHICKLLIILDYNNGNFPESSLFKLVKVTFKSINEAFIAKDPIMLRQIVEFFLDITQRNEETNAIKNYSHYEENIQSLISVIENGSEFSPPDCYDPECVAIVFAFIHGLIRLELNCMKQFYPNFIKMSLNWIQAEVVSSESLSILKTIAVSQADENSNILEPLANGLPIFLIALSSGTSEEQANTEHNKRISALLQLLRAMLKVQSLQPKVLIDLKEETMHKVFCPLIKTAHSPRAKIEDSSEEAVSRYVYAIALVHEMAKFDQSWIQFLDELLNNRQIHLVCSQALYTGSKDLKLLVLNIASLPTFPKENIASAMSAMQSIFHTDPQSAKKPSVSFTPDVNIPVLSVAQIDRLDQVLSKIKDAIADHNTTDIATSQVMELYEYKLAAMGYAERAAMASVEAASERCTQFQHRTAQLMAELNKFHQLLYHTQQCHEQAVKAKNYLEEHNKEWKTAFESEKCRNKSLQNQLAAKEREVGEFQHKLEEAFKRFGEVTQSKLQLEEQYSTLKVFVKKLEDNLTRSEKILVKKDDNLKSANSTIERLRQEINTLEEHLRRKESELQTNKFALEEAHKEVEKRKAIIDMITQVAAGQK